MISLTSSPILRDKNPAMAHSSRAILWLILELCRKSQGGPGPQLSLGDPEALRRGRHPETRVNHLWAPQFSGLRCYLDESRIHSRERKPHLSFCISLSDSLYFGVRSIFTKCVTKMWQMDNLHFINRWLWPEQSGRVLYKRELLRRAVTDAGPKSAACPVFWGTDGTDVSRLKFNAFSMNTLPFDYKELEQGLHA